MDYLKNFLFKNFLCGVAETSTIPKTNTPSIRHFHWNQPMAPPAREPIPAPAPLHAVQAMY
ncbi:uncharacterized protein DS421_6g193490 [Arachis hypogaea]|nr:uncharacterized protein DS421_6g193490 [Arachis hypogaea]